MFRKTAKRVLGALLGIVMALMVVTPAYAATININGAHENETYTAYKLFDVETAGEGESKAYAYYIEANEGNANLISVLNAEASPVELEMTADGSQYVIKSGLDNETDAAALAKYLNTSENIAKLGTGKTGTFSGGVYTIDGLDEGYYFVTSTAGSLCYLQSADDVANVNEKNEAPSVEKKILIDSTTKVDENTVSIGDKVDYVITVTMQPGATGYVLHDMLDNGLDLDASSIKVYSDESMLTELSTGSYTLNTTDLSDSCSFELSFAQDYLDTVSSANTKVYVTYTATVNESATVGVSDPNTNDVYLKYGVNSSTAHDDVDTYLYDFTITKTDGENPLAGAEFSLYTSAEGEEAVKFIYDSSTNTYRVATTEEINAESSQATETIKVNDQGVANVSGLKGQNYWLEETKAPEGYNKLTARVQVNFSNEQDSLSQVSLEDKTVINNAGQELPSTGGMGTTALYVVGGALVIGAGITLVVRRRMSAEA